ncbi:MAG TPA: hypothetical protein VFP32_02060 [Candidatus Saccharimonadales bacterium]|nr:hypothetical protein [Candidatus Saccharimonadales bacterium]
MAVVSLGGGRALAVVSDSGAGTPVSGLMTKARVVQAARHTSELRAKKAHTRTVRLRHQETSLRRGIRFYRTATWRWQDLALVQRTPSRYGERQLQSVGYLNWMAELWRHRAAKAKHYVKRLLSNRGYLPAPTARQLGHLLAVKLYGWGGSQWVCLDTIWGTREGVMESGWKVTADNPTSQAHGIPQANPGSKMSRFGANWLTSAWVQIKWGLWYIKNKYHTPCGALDVRRAQGSY